MDDIDILNELLDQRVWWENALRKEENRVNEIKKQLSKVNRLIGLFDYAEPKDSK